MTITSVVTGILDFMIRAFAHSWPYLLLTIPLAVGVNVSGVSRFIGRAFHARPLTAVFLATAVGAFSPFCSCGVIPVISALLISGVPVAPVMSFWLASPSMDPEIFMLSVSSLGMNLAVWRLAGTFAMSLGGGILTLILVNRGWLSGSVLKIRREDREKAGCSCGSESVSSSCCADGTRLYDGTETVPELRTAAAGEEASTCAPENSFLKKLVRESGRAVFMVVKFMTLAFLLEALITLFVPREWVINLLGRGNAFAVPAAALLSIPLYTTNLTALGLAGGLLTQGMSGGAVLSFLIGGATTTIPAMAAVYGLVKTRIFLLYLAITAFSALSAGLIYQFFH